MDRGAWQVTDHGVTKALNTNLVTKQQQHGKKKKPLNILSLIYSIILFLSKTFLVCMQVKKQQLDLDTE